MKLKGRFVYFLYYIKELDYRKFRRFVNYSSNFCGRSKIQLLADSFYSVFKYNISLMDYFNLRFFLMDITERLKWAGTGYMYEYQLKMNPKESRDVLSDKIKFLNHFKNFVKRGYSDINILKNDTRKSEKLLSNKSGRVVLKNSRGQIGAEVEVIRCNDYTFESLIDYMVKHNYDLVEEYVVQHPDLMELSSSGLNTVRIITQLAGGRIDFIGGRLRISVDSPVDNMAAGNLAAAIDLQSGVITGVAVYSDITKPQLNIHPVTGKPITGFVIPFWKEVIDLAERAAFHTPENRSVGWDIAITAEGPELIEGNHNWCKLLWQLPVQQGLKHELDKYL